MAFISYFVAILAFLLVYDPINRYLTSGYEPRPLPRTPRPRINESLLALDTSNETVLSCSPDAYSVHILSKAPLVVYVENFLSLDEREHLLEIRRVSVPLFEPLFEPSTVTNDGDKTQRNALIRDSEVALIPRTDTVRCVEARARSFQGWRDDLWIERLRTQRYGPSQHYTHHFDWGSGAQGWGRVSSFMVWVQSTDDLEGGGTEFPRLQRNGPDQAWCRWVECSDAKSANTDDGLPNKEDNSPITGVTFKAIAGNAVFWENFRPDGTGRGFPETWHAGLSVTRGTKVGLNIWSWGRL
ncbi:hypothetical protein F4808DRAFT_464572 [Astrocystis sublimbata]|nr:hypothetical protein F4808DRAFT_464572 [Astrocystis sublimbata]